MPISPRRAVLSVLLMATSASQAADLASCAGITGDSERLACYDRASGRQGPAAAPVAPAAPAPPEAATPLTGSAPAAGGSFLSQHWELDEADKRGTFRFRAHNDNYLLLANLNSAPNGTPFRPTNPLSSRSAVGPQHVELAFQLGFKTKLVEHAAGSRGDLWFGYTQQSYWQAYNAAASRPFRETNYQPELMAVLPLDLTLAGFRARFVNLGLVHQSNGQSGTQSRSWNRLYAQLGVERGALALSARVWRRLDGGADDDDNPDILDYMGRGDVTASWRHEGHELSLTARRNFSTRHGALQASWAFPVAAGLKGYVQVFSGYGQSLIDYNFAQKSLGLGFLIDF
jgi:phospholipase A1